MQVHWYLLWRAHRDPRFAWLNPRHTSGRLRGEDRRHAQLSQTYSRSELTRAGIDNKVIVKVKLVWIIFGRISSYWDYHLRSRRPCLNGDWLERKVNKSVQAWVTRWDHRQSANCRNVTSLGFHQGEYPLGNLGCQVNIWMSREVCAHGRRLLECYSQTNVERIY